jgi:hypothetical protein
VELVHFVPSQIVTFRLSLRNVGAPSENIYTVLSLELYVLHESSVVPWNCATFSYTLHIDTRGQPRLPYIKKSFRIQYAFS